MFNAPVSDLDEGGFTAPPEDLSGGFNAPAEDLAPQSEIPQLKPWNPTLLDRLQQFGQNIRQSGPVESLLGPTDQEKAGQSVVSNPNRISTEGLLGALSSDEKTTALGESAANLLKTVSSNQPQNIILDHVAKLGGVVGGSAQVAQGIHDAVLDFVGHMAVDPRNYLLGMGFLSKYPALARTVSGVFGAQMAAQVPAAAQAAGAASVDGTPREQATAYANLGISTAFPLLAGVHAAHGETAPTVNHTLPGQFKPAVPLDNSEPFSTPNADAILSQNKGQIPIAFTPLNEDTSTTVEQPPTQPSAPPPPIRPPTKPVIAPPAEDILNAANIQPPTQNASEIPIPASVPQPEIRPPVGETPPLRQQGEVATARPEELAPSQSAIEPVNALTPPQVSDLRSKVFDNLRGPQEFSPADFTALDTHLKQALGPDTPSVAQMQQAGILNVTPLENGKVRVEPPQPTLQPALLVNGKPITGGATHAEILGTITEQAKAMVAAGKRDEGVAFLEAGIEANKTDAQHVFVDQSGKIYSRTEAATALGRTGELHSQDLPQPSNPTIAAPVELRTAGEILKPWQKTKSQFIAQREAAEGVPSVAGSASEKAMRTAYELDHQHAVEGALRSNLPVPAEVLKDYPPFDKSLGAFGQSKKQPSLLRSQKVSALRGKIVQPLKESVPVQKEAVGNLERALSMQVDKFNARTKEGYNQHINEAARGNPTKVEQPNLSSLTPKESVFHETSPANAVGVMNGLLRPFKQSWTQFFASDNPDLALGQNGKGVLFELDPKKVNGFKHDKPGTTEHTGFEYNIDRTVKGAIKSVTFVTKRQMEKFQEKFPKSFDYSNPVQTERGLKVERQAASPTAIPKPVEGVKEPPKSEGGQPKPAEPVNPAPVTPEAKQPTALETINTSPKVSVKLPEGATMVRTTIKYKDREIQKVISKKDLEKFNPFAGSENVKLEAGTIRSGGMFSPVLGKVEVRAKETSKPNAAFSVNPNENKSESSNPVQPVRSELKSQAPSKRANSDNKSGLAARADELASRLEGLKTGIGKGGQLHAFGIAADLWDRAVSVAQEIIRAGGTVAGAIAKAIEHIKANHVGEFDEAGAREALQAEANPPPSMEDFIKSTVAPSDEQAFHQTAGVPNLGTEYKPERIQATREAVQQTRFSAEGPTTEAKVGEFYRLLQEFTDKPTRRQAMDSLVADVKAHTGDETGELAPALLYAELRDFAAKMLLRGDVTPLFKIRSLSNEFATIAGEVTSAGARAMRGLQEGEGKTLLKSLYELTKTRLKEEGAKLGVSDELYQQLVDSLDNAEVDKKDLENTITTGKNTEGQTIDDILGTAKPEEVVKTKPEREKRAKQELDSDSEKSAKKIINDLQLKRGAEWLKPEVPRGRVDEIKEFVKNYLKGRLPDDPLKDPMNPEEDYQRPQPGSTLSDIEARKVADELEKLGVTPSSAIVLAHELIQEREVKFGNERLKQMRQAANSRSVKSLVESILGTPLRAQSDPAWVKATAMHWFMDNGLSREQADAAYRIFNKQFQDAFVRAQEKIAKSILKSGEAKTLDAVVKQIRSGLFDPSHPGFEPFSAKIGLKGMPKADLEKLAELDDKLSKGLKSMPEVVMTTDHMLAILRRNKLPPSVLKTFAANYSISQLSGIRTMTIHAFAGVAHLLHERVLATLSQWPTADNLSILWKPVARAAKDFVDQLRFGWGAGHSYFPMRELEAGEDVLRQQFEQGAKEFKSGSLKERSVGALRMLSGVQNFTMRLLNALNQANIIAVRDAQLPLFGSMAFKELGLNPKQIAAIIDVLPSFRSAAYTDAIDRGFSPLHARVIAHDIEQEYLADFFGQTARSPELKAALKKGATYEGLSIVGRLAKGVKEQEEGGILSRYGGLHALIRITGQMSHTPEGRIGKLYMFGYVAVPTRMARFEAWNSAYGLLRLGIDKIQRTHGWESWWKQSLATKQQREYRLRMALAATAVQGLLLGGLVAGGAALLGRRSTADPDAGKDKFAWYITGNGPQNKDLRDAWSHMGFQPNSIVLALNGKVHVAIPITRVGETLGHMLWGYSAADDYAWRKKEAEAHGKIDPTTGVYVPGKFDENAAVTAFQAIGNYASIIGERGPLQTVLQMGRGNESPQIALASAAGKLLAPAVPFAGLQRSVRDMIVGQVDYSTPESAFEANFPVLGWTGSTQAINRLGDSLYDHSWYAKIARTGLPIAVGVADTSENQQLYTAILNQGVAIPALSRTRVEDEYGQLTQDQWNQFAKTSGTTLKSSLLSNLNTLQNTDPADARKLVSINANAADATAARSMGLEKQSSSRSSGATAPSSGPPRQTRPSSLRSGLRPHSRVHRIKLNHAGRMASGLRHRTGSLLRGHRRSAYA